MADENDTKPTPATNEAIEAPVASEASSSSSTSSTTAPPAATAVTESTTPSMPPKSDEPKNQAVPTKFELPEDLKSIHDSPAPRDGPISQPDDQPTDPEEREKLLENAITFLERSRDAPLDQKQEFLRAKGLTPEEVEDLILKLERKQRKREGKRRERNGQVNIRVF
jgi:predicted component of type VI protein secretion system